MALLHQRQQQQHSPRHSMSKSSSLLNTHHRTILSPTGLMVLLSLVVVLGIFSPWIGVRTSLFSSNGGSQLRWRDYTLAQALETVARNGTVIVCAVSQPYLPFLNNWLISISKQKHQDKVLVIAEDYATLYKVNKRWPGHAVLIPPAPDLQTSHRFGSQGFFNFTSRRPRHLLQILDLGYGVMYNDVDMVWLGDPFPFLKGNYDVYFTDDMTAVFSLPLLCCLVVTDKLNRAPVRSLLPPLHVLPPRATVKFGITSFPYTSIRERVPDNYPDCREQTRVDLKADNKNN